MQYAASNAQGSPLSERALLLARCGAALFGEQWQRPLADALQVNYRTVGRWLSGAMPMHDGIWRDIEGLLDANELELRNARTLLLEQFGEGS